MRILLVAGLVVGTSVAHAERTTTVNLGAMFGAVENGRDVETAYMKPAGGPRLTLAWENAMPAMPAADGRNADLAFVPELTAGAIMNDERGEAMIGVGARGELRMSIRGPGMLGNARFSVYVAARALVIGDHKDTAGELVGGAYVYLGRSRVRFGGEAGVIGREQTDLMYVHNREIGVFASMYLGWAL